MMMTGLLLAILLVCVALVIDIGHAQLVQRQLQAGVDAAALAGAQDLPETAVAEETARSYSPTPGSKNAVNTVDNATTTVQARCLPDIPGCNTRYATSNAISVSATARVPTFFGRLVGVDSLTVRAKATACFPCSVRPLDIMLVLDRTGSMCDKPGDDARDNDCTDLGAARQGIETFISLMDPKLDRVGLAVLPPAVGPPVYRTENAPPCKRWKFGKPKTDANCIEWTQVQVRNPDSPENVCDLPDDDNHYFGYDAYTPWWKGETDTGYRGQDRAFYVVSSLTDDDVDGDPSDDYVKPAADGGWDLNPDSPLVQTIACVKAGGSTSYSMAIEEAAHELEIHGRPDVQDVIVFFTDGGANTRPGLYANGYWADGSTWRNRPCGSGVHASELLPADTAVYTIGYDLENETSRSQRCQKPDSDGHQDLSSGSQKEDCQTWGCSPSAALKAIASSPPGTNDNFYYTADPETLRTLFARVAGDVLTNAARLVSNDLPDLTE